MSQPAVRRRLSRSRSGISLRVHLDTDPSIRTSDDRHDVRASGVVSEWVVLPHAAVAFWFVAGLLGRNVTMARARSADDLSTLVELVDLSGREGLPTEP